MNCSLDAQIDELGPVAVAIEIAIATSYFVNLLWDGSNRCRETSNLDRRDVDSLSLSLLMLPLPPLVANRPGDQSSCHPAFSRA